MTPPQVDPLIRVAGSRDVDAIVDVHIASWQAAYRGQIPDDILERLPETRTRRLAIWRDAIEHGDPRRCVLVAEVGGRVRAFCSLGPTEDDDARAETGEIYAIYADASVWGKGIGRAIFAEGVRRLSDLGFRRATLWVLATNARARRFYEAAGWRADGATKNDLQGGFMLREVRYATLLGASGRYGSS